MKNNLFLTVQRLIATCFYVGYSPIMPGTCGSLCAVLICWFCFDSFFTMPFIVAIIVLTFLGRYVSNTISNVDQDDDPKYVVIDEMVGMMLALLFVPKTIFFLAAGFVLFRFFDIVKPYPIKNFEHVPHGYGVMLDDMVAGVFVNIILQISIFFIR